MTIRLYSYWRSSAAYRVRIALNLKGLDHDIVSVSLAPGVSEHRGEDYRAKNPQMLVPFLEDGDQDGPMASAHQPDSLLSKSRVNSPMLGRYIAVD